MKEMKPPTDTKNLTVFHWVKNLFTEPEELTTAEVEELKKPVEDDEWDKLLWTVIAGEE